MKKWLIGGGIALVLALGLFAMITSNRFIGQEAGITAAYDRNQAELDKATNTIAGTGLATDAYKDLVIQSLKVGMEGRYGMTGSKAAMQFIKESQPNIDPSVFLKLQQVIEAQYAQWAAAQTDLRDRARVYEVELRSFPGSLVAGMFGYPRIDLALYKRMIVTESTAEAFQTGRMQGVGQTLGKKPQ